MDAIKWVPNFVGISIFWPADRNEEGQANIYQVS